MGGRCQWEHMSHMEVWLKYCYYMYHWWSVPHSVTVVVSETDHDARKIMSLLCTAQTVLNKDLKKQCFAILAMGVLWVGEHVCAGTCNIMLWWQII